MSRKLLLTLHLIASIGWLGALIVFLAHALASVVSTDEHVVRATSLAMGITAWFVILPFAVATLGTGVAQALASAWGLLRHYWIVFKLFLTLVATVVLVVKLAPINELAAAAYNMDLSATSGLRTSLLVHAAGGFVILLGAAVLGIYKPAGRTPWAGKREAMPGWVKASVVPTFILIVLLVAMVLVGKHGPH